MFTGEDLSGWAEQGAGLRQSEGESVMAVVSDTCLRLKASSDQVRDVPGRPFWPYRARLEPGAHQALSQPSVVISLSHLSYTFSPIPLCPVLYTRGSRFPHALTPPCGSRAPRQTLPL